MASTSEILPLPAAEALLAATTAIAERLGQRFDEAAATATAESWRPWGSPRAAELRARVRDASAALLPALHAYDEAKAAWQVAVVDDRQRQDEQEEFWASVEADRAELAAYDARLAAERARFGPDVDDFAGGLFLLSH